MVSIKNTLAKLNTAQFTSLCSSLNAKERKQICKQDLSKNIKSIKDISLFHKIASAQNYEIELKDRYKNTKLISKKCGILAKYLSIFVKILGIYTKNTVKKTSH